MAGASDSFAPVGYFEEIGVRELLGMKSLTAREIKTRGRV